jgi:acyl-CoA synthetase (NDP forming)
VSSQQVDVSPLARIFCARSVAVVGASPKPEKVGHLILANILQGGYTGRLYPINPSAEKILGLTAYPSLAAVPEPLDLVVLAIPAPQIEEILQQAASLDVHGAVVISGGFREVGRIDLEDSLARIAHETGMRILGPNCQGFSYRANQLCASWPLVAEPGPFAILSQSGTVGAALAGWAVEEGLGVSATVSLGNQVDLCETDFVDFFGRDPGTNAIAMYLEGVKNGRRFMEVARRVLLRKPLIVLKSGRTGGGQRAAASHTRSLAGRDEVFGGMCRQLGIIRAPDLESFYDASKALGLLPVPKGNRLLVVTSSGGSGILAVDTAERCGLSVPPLDASLVEDLRDADIPANAVLSNPLDLTMCTAQQFKAAVQLLVHRATADLVLLIFGDPIPGAAEVARWLKENSRMCVAVAFLGGAEVEKKERLSMHSSGVPVFPTPERAVRAMAAAAWYGRKVQGLQEGVAADEAGSGTRRAR